MEKKMETIIVCRVTLGLCRGYIAHEVSLPLWSGVSVRLRAMRQSVGPV